MLTPTIASRQLQKIKESLHDILSLKMNPFKQILLCLPFVLLLLQTPLFAQPREQLDYLVLNSGDTLYGEVKHIDERGVHREFYKKIRLTTIAGKKKKYKREDIVSFRSANSHYESFWLHQTSQKIMLVNSRYDIDIKHGEQYFLRVMSKGKLSHYALEWFEQGDAALWSMSLLKKETDTFFMRADQGLISLKRKVLFSYFSDCPALQEKIKQKQVNSVHEVLDFYNETCVE
jgi:hypothetical protein